MNPCATVYANTVASNQRGDTLGVLRACRAGLAWACAIAWLSHPTRDHKFCLEGARSVYLMTCCMCCLCHCPRS